MTIMRGRNVGKSGQGALEYLLLVGGSVLLAVIVIAAVTGIAKNSGNTIGESAICVAKTGCSSCKADPNCAGYKADSTVIVWETGVDCTANDAKNFAFCKAK